VSERFRPHCSFVQIQINQRIVGLVDYIEKLINEHGSAEIMEKRLVLFKEQAAAIDARANELQTENSRLSRELQAARAEMEQLRNQIAAQQTSQLETGAEQLLQLLFQRDFTPTAAGDQLGMSKGMVEYYHGTLVERDFSRWSGLAISGDWGESEAEMSITHDGRAYCVRYGLAQ
jgi:hypothetical protein